MSVTISELIEQKNSFLLVRFLLIFFLFLATSFSITFLTYSFLRNVEISEARESEVDRLELMKAHVENQLDTIQADLSILLAHAELDDYVSEHTDSSRVDIQEELLALAKARGFYDQIRYIDENGNEQVRINKADSNYYAVSVANLQNKADRYYYQETKQLAEGEVYISPLDLNIENDQIEEPLKPMIRFGSPVYFEDEFKGIIVLNYLAKELFNRLDEFYLQNPGTLLVANSDGYFLKHPEASYEFGFMYPEKEHLTVQNFAPQAWGQILGVSDSQFEFNNGLISHLAISPYLNTLDTNKVYPYDIESYQWHLISFGTYSELSEKSLLLISRLLFGILALLPFALLFAWGLALALEKRTYSEKRLKHLYGLFKIMNRTLRHDLRSKLTEIRWGLELTKGFERRTGLRGAYQATEKSLELIRQMKQLEQMYTRGKVDLKTVQVSDILSDLVVNREIPITIHGDAVIFVDDGFKSVMDNLIRNAIMHSGTDKVDIHIKKQKQSVEIRVIDYGKGIPNELKTEVFKEGAKFGETGNTGLGLYIVEQTILRYNGTVKIEDTKPSGATFVITLPLKK